MSISQGYCRRTTPDRCSPVRTVELVLVERVMSAVWETTHLAHEAAAPKDAPEADFFRTHTRQSGVRWVKNGASRDQLMRPQGADRSAQRPMNSLNHPTTDSGKRF